MVERIKEWHRRNPGQTAKGVLSSNTNAQMMYETMPQATYVSAAPSFARMPTVDTNTLIPQLTKEDCIVLLEYEL